MATPVFDTNAKFSELGLDRRLFKAIAKIGFVHPTPVQAQTVPKALEGRDVIVRAKTGSGKTLAYALPLLQRILRFKESNPSARSGVRAIVLVPTRELCDQVRDQLLPLLFYCRDLVSLLSISAEAPKAAQAVRLKECPDIVISTPARLVEHLSSGVVSLKESLLFLAIDEADMILSFGYESDLRALVDYLPNVHQTMLISATVGLDVKDFAKLALREPALIDVQEAASPQGGLQQYYLPCSEADKFLLGYALVKLQLVKGKTLLFVNSVERCFRLKLFFEQFSISSAVLNAELPYNSRQNILQQFNRGVFDYLIATDASMDEDEEGDRKDQSDVKELTERNSDDQARDRPDADAAEAASKKVRKSRGKDRNTARRGEFGVARGIDFQNVATVVNFDFPTSYKNYVHRSGRTARGGASGTALSFVTPADRGVLQDVRTAQLEEGMIVLDNNGTATSALQPLPFNSADVEGFRYRVEDQLRAVTQAAVREARVKELKLELMNSKRLKAHFEDNPRELDLLRHDKVLRPTKVQQHLAHVPRYLVPPSLEVPHDKQSNAGKKHTGKRKGGPSASWKKSHSQGDPLKSFQFKPGGGGKRAKHHASSTRNSR